MNLYIYYTVGIDHVTFAKNKQEAICKFKKSLGSKINENNVNVSDRDVIGVESYE